MINQEYTSLERSLDERERRLEERERQFDEKVTKTLAYISSALQELSSEFSQTQSIPETIQEPVERRERYASERHRYQELPLKTSLRAEEQSYIDGFTALKQFYNRDAVCQRNVPMSRSILFKLQQGEDDIKRDINDGLYSFSSRTSAYADGGQRFVDTLKEVTGDIGVLEVRLESVLNQGLSEVAIKELEQGQDMQISEDQVSRS